MNQYIDSITAAVTKAMTEALSKIPAAPTMTELDLIRLLEGMNDEARGRVAALLSLNQAGLANAVKEGIEKHFDENPIQADEVDGLDSAIEDQVERAVEDMEVEANSVSGLSRAIREEIAEIEFTVSVS